MTIFIQCCPKKYEIVRIRTIFVSMLCINYQGNLVLGCQRLYRCTQPWPIHCLFVIQITTVKNLSFVTFFLEDLSLCSSWSLLWPVMATTTTAWIMFLTSTPPKVTGCWYTAPANCQCSDRRTYVKNGHSAQPPFTGKALHVTLSLLHICLCPQYHYYDEK